MATLVVETGAGLSTANSFATVAEADVFWSLNGSPTVWTEATEDQKSNALIQATQDMEVRYRRRWSGVRVEEDQALAWPRSGVEDADGFGIDSDVVPKQVKNACALLAKAILDGDNLVPDEAAGAQGIRSKSIQVGELSKSVTYNGSASTSKKYKRVEELLAEFLMGRGGSGQGELRRA